jgi:hypothetical protein
MFIYSQGRNIRAASNCKAAGLTHMLIRVGNAVKLMLPIALRGCSLFSHIPHLHYHYVSVHSLLSLGESATREGPMALWGLPTADFQTAMWAAVRSVNGDLSNTMTRSDLAMHAWQM